MSDTNSYLLQMLFDGAESEVANLKQRVQAAIASQASQVELRFETASIGPVMSLRGSLESVDECHHQINNALLGNDALACVRLVDEASDEVRRQAYPILSSTEQHLRAFINRKAIEVLGFGWWDRYAPAELQNKVRRNAGKGVGITLLEGTQFQDLVELITYKYLEWPSDKNLSVAELSELMVDCTSFEQFQTKLVAKTASISLWDKVFARYFSPSSGKK